MSSQSADGLATCFVRHYCLCLVSPVAGQWDVGLQVIVLCRELALLG